MPHLLRPGQRVFAVGDIYGDHATVRENSIGDQIATSAGTAGELRKFVLSDSADASRVEAVYVQFDQPDGRNVPDRHTAGWVPRKAVCTSRFGHVSDPGQPCVFCGYIAA